MSSTYRFIIEHPDDGWTVEMKADGDMNCTGVVEVFRHFLLAAGFQERTVDDALGIIDSGKE